MNDIEEELNQEVIQHEKIVAIEEKIFAIIELLIYEDKTTERLIEDLLFCQSERGTRILSDPLLSRMLDLKWAVDAARDILDATLNAVYHPTEHSAHDCPSTIL